MTETTETIDVRTLWSAAVPGTVLPLHDDWPCGARNAGDLQCTRQAGHTGQHVATAARTVVAVWPGDQR